MYYFIKTKTQVFNCQFAIKYTNWNIFQFVIIYQGLQFYLFKLQQFVSITKIVKSHS